MKFHSNIFEFNTSTEVLFKWKSIIKIVEKIRRIVLNNFIFIWSHWEKIGGVGCIFLIFVVCMMMYVADGAYVIVV